MSLRPFGPDWVMKEKIGSGTYGVVYRAEKNTMGNIYERAIKYISVPPKDIDPYQFITNGQASDEESIKALYQDCIKQFITEIDICENLKDAFIVMYEDHEILPKADGEGYDIFIKMELLEPLEQFMASKKWTEKEVLQLGIDICSALEVLEVKRIIHRDIKPANIFVSDNGKRTIYKLGDFGEAKILSGIVNFMTQRGSYPYMSPEIFRRDPNADIRADIYSLGMVMYRFLNNNRGPFVDPYSRIISSEENTEADTRRLNGEEFNASPCNCSIKELSEAILRACKGNPNQRWRTPTEFKNALISIQEALIVQEKDKTIRADKLYRESSSVDSSNTHYSPLGKATEYNMQSSSEQSTQNRTYNPNNPERPKKSLLILAAVLGVSLILAVGVFVGIKIINPTLNQNSDSNSSSVSETDKSNKESLSADRETIPSTSDVSSENSQLYTSESVSIAAESFNAVNKVRVVSYINMSFDEAKTQIEQTGLVVGQPDYVYSSDIEAGNVVKQSITAGSEIEEKTSIKLTISRGPNFSSLPANCIQVLNVVSSGNNATMTLYDLTEIGWIKTFSCRATVGQNGIGSNYGENKKITPKGTFPLGVVLSQKRMTYGMEWQPCTDSTVIVEDVNSSYYNQIKDKSELASGTEYDPIGYRLNNNVNNACVFIEHNGNGYNSYNVAKGAGSSITICGCYASIEPTWGCIDISANDMETLLNLLNSSKHPYIKTE